MFDLRAGHLLPEPEPEPCSMLALLWPGLGYTARVSLCLTPGEMISAVYLVSESRGLQILAPGCPLLVTPGHYQSEWG